MTGSVATVKCRELIHSFLDLNYDVRVVATKSALHFVALSEDYDVESKTRLEDAIALRRKSSASSTTTTTSIKEDTTILSPPGAGTIIHQEEKEEA